MTSLAEALYALDGQPVWTEASAWPGSLRGLVSPGLYAWRVDALGAENLSRGLGIELPEGRIYVGQSSHFVRSPGAEPPRLAERSRDGTKCAGMLAAVAAARVAERGALAWAASWKCVLFASADGHGSWTSPTSHRTRAASDAATTAGSSRPAAARPARAHPRAVSRENSAFRMVKPCSKVVVMAAATLASGSSPRSRRSMSSESLAM